MTKLSKKTGKSIHSISEKWIFAAVFALLLPAIYILLTRDFISIGDVPQITILGGLSALTLLSLPILFRFAKSFTTLIGILFTLSYLKFLVVPGVGISFIKLYSLFLIAIWIFSFIALSTKKLELIPWKYTIFLLLFNVILLVNLDIFNLNGFDMYNYIDTCKKYNLLLLSMIIIYDCIKSRKAIDQCEKFLLAGIGFIAVQFIFESLFNYRMTDSGFLMTERAQGITGDSNYAGMFMLAALPFVLRKTKRKKIYQILILGTILIAIYYSFSRTTYLMTMLFFMYKTGQYLYHRFRAAGLVLYGMIGLISAAIGLTCFYLEPFPDSPVLKRIYSLKTRGVQGDTSLRLRYNNAMAAVYMARDYPLMGIGTGQFLNNPIKQKYLLQYGGNSSSVWAHNSYLDIVAQSGFSGLLAYIMLIGLPIILFFRVWKKLTPAQKIQAYPWMEGYCVMIIFNVFLSAYLEKQQWFYWIILIALFNIIQRENQRKIVNEPQQQPELKNAESLTEPV